LEKRLARIVEGSGKILLALALVALAILPIAGLYSRNAALASAQQKAQLKPTDLKQRAMHIVMALGADKPFIGEPRFVVQRFQSPRPHRERRLWVVDCVAGLHTYNMIFNDLTGNVESIFSDGLTTSSRAALRAGATAVTSQTAAIEGAVRRLKDLEMLPKGTRIALAASPLCDHDGLTWRMTWKVLLPGAATPHEIRMILNGRDATPMVVVNCRELEAYAQN
jgi:hypothetical protein